MLVLVFFMWSHKYFSLWIKISVKFLKLRKWKKDKTRKCIN